MSETALLIKVVKKELKNQGLKYRDLARLLDISEASVKRMFSEGNFSLQRLNEICTALDIRFADLASMMKSEERRTDSLSYQQEQELVADIKLLLMAFLVINGWKFDQVQCCYRYTEHEAVQYLAHLDRLGIIELLPGNRIKLLISPKFTWRRDGPMQQFFVGHLQQDFLKHGFAGREDSHYFITGMLTEDVAHELEARIESLVQEFKNRNLENIHEPLEKRQIYSMLVAMRPWRPHAFDELRC